MAATKKCMRLKEMKRKQTSYGNTSGLASHTPSACREKSKPLKAKTVESFAFNSRTPPSSKTTIGLVPWSMLLEKEPLYGHGFVSGYEKTIYSYMTTWHSMAFCCGVGRTSTTYVGIPRRILHVNGTCAIYAPGNRACGHTHRTRIHGHNLA